LKKSTKPSDRAGALPPRSQDDCLAELANIDQAHIQNEAGRDGFLALAHTGLFAASIAFIGGISEAAHAKCLWLLIFAWFTSVVGLVALTISYHVASQHINKRRQQIYEQTADSPNWAMFLNHIALWSFPFALVSTFVFATVNMLAA
jgi:hypothetical protein